jgi:hypothetical protein
VYQDVCVVTRLTFLCCTTGVYQGAVLTVLQSQCSSLHMYQVTHMYTHEQANMFLFLPQNVMFGLRHGEICTLVPEYLDLLKPVFVCYQTFHSFPLSHLLVYR